MSSLYLSLNKLLGLFDQFQVENFIDILIIALLIYTLFLFFRRAKTYLVYWGIGITVCLYFLARELNLYVTFLTLRYFAGISFILFAIIFQSELRKYIEVLGLIGSRQLNINKPTGKSPIISELVQTCVQLARAKVGALIVIKADNNISNIVEGGVPLDGEISEEILMSIFDSSSDGHDGAVLVIDNRISKFGVQLPLSTNFREIGKHGTRHSAALGLSEVSDALCIVCSEEKGTIGIAKEGKLKILTKYEELEKYLVKYLNPPIERPEMFLAHIVAHNTFLKVLALVSSLFIWIFITLRR